MLCEVSGKVEARVFSASPKVDLRPLRWLPCCPPGPGFLPAGDGQLFEVSWNSHQSPGLPNSTQSRASPGEKALVGNPYPEPIRRFALMLSKRHESFLACVRVP